MKNIFIILCLMSISIACSQQEKEDPSTKENNDYLKKRRVEISLGRRFQPRQYLCYRYMVKNRGLPKIRCRLVQNNESRL